MNSEQTEKQTNPCRVVRAIKSFGLLLVAVVITSCDADIGNHVVWAPDKSTFAVLAEDGLHLANVDGKISSTLAPGIEKLEWLPDSKQAVVVEKQTLRTWDQLEKRLTPEEVAKVKDESARLK